MKHGFYESNVDESEYMFFCKSNKCAILAHFHKSAELLYVIDGKVEATIEGVTKTLFAGEFVIVNPYEVHAYNKTNALNIVLVLSEVYLREVFVELDNKIFENFCKDENKEILTLLEKWHSEERTLLLDKGYSNVLYATLLKNCKIKPKKQTDEHPIMLKLLQYINENYKENISLSTLAHHFKYNEVYISKLFNEYVKTNFRNFLNRVRIYKVKQLLEESSKNCTILDYAFSCGFESAITFYRAYKKEFENTDN